MPLLYMMYNKWRSIMPDIDERRRYRGAASWERPNPPRLNDTAAIQRRGTHPYELVLRGEETIASAGRWTSPLETAWNPEHAFPPTRPNGGRQPPQIAASPPYGGGGVVAVHTPRRSEPGATPNGRGRGNPSPDKNRTVPGNGGGSLKDAINCCIPKGC
jgi:hypothetical protein